jgi:hypothetical protein
VVTVYRSEHSKQRCRSEGTLSVTPLAPENDAGQQDGKRRSTPILTERRPIGTRPQLWISLWTDRTVQGRRPT